MKVGREKIKYDKRRRMRKKGEEGKEEKKGSKTRKKDEWMSVQGRGGEEVEEEE